MLRFTSFICAGGPFGTVIAMPASSYLCEYLGWESVFYVFGALGCLWFIFWAILIHDGPERHPNIKDKEKIFLQVWDKYYSVKKIKTLNLGHNFEPFFHRVLSLPFL